MTRTVPIASFILFIIFISSCSSPEAPGNIYFSDDSSLSILRISANNGEAIEIIGESSGAVPFRFGSDSLFLASYEPNEISFSAYLVSSGERISLKDRNFDTLKTRDWAFFIEKINEDGGSIMWIPRIGAAALPITSPGELARDLAISSDGGTVAYSALFHRAKNRSIVVKVIPDGKVLAFFDTKKDDTHPTISPDGFWVAFQSGSDYEAEILVGHIPSKSTKKLTSGKNPVWGL